MTAQATTGPTHAWGVEAATTAAVTEVVGVVVVVVVDVVVETVYKFTRLLWNRLDRREYYSIFTRQVIL